MPIDKKNAKLQYLKQQLDDPNVSEWEKDRIRLRLGISLNFSEKDFSEKENSELLRFVSKYIDNQLKNIRQRKRTNAPFDYLSDNLKAIYFLSMYDVFFEDDTLEQMYDISESLGELEQLANSFKLIKRHHECALIEPLLHKKSIKSKEIEKLQEYFWDNTTAVQEIEAEIEKFIKDNINELVALQNL